MDILLKDVKLFNSSNKKTNIVIEDNQITDIHSNANLPSPEITITGKRLYASLPLFNAHTHLPMTLLRGYSDDLPLFPWLQKIWNLEKNFTAESCSIGAQLAFLEMIKSGTGAFCDFYFHEDKILPIAQQSGLRGLLGAGIIEGTFLEKGGSKWMLNTAEKLIKEINSKNSLILPAVAPHAPHTCSDETLWQSLDIVDKYKVPLTIHTSETRDDVINIQKKEGLPPIEWLDKKYSFFSNRDVIAVHCVWIQQREIDILAKNNAGVAYCPVSGQKLAYGGLTPVPEMISAGVNVGLGTDGPASNNTLDMVREMRSAINLISHNRWDPSLITSKQIFDLTTLSFRKRFFGLPVLRVGSPADVVIFDFSTPHTIPIHDPISTLVFSANGSNTHSLIVAGKLLLHEREVKTFNEEKTIEKAEKEIERILMS
ncbi:MAG: amidohydrolase [Candidatus Thorarchaeota archaeon]